MGYMVSGEGIWMGIALRPVEVGGDGCLSALLLTMYHVNTTISEITACKKGRTLAQWELDSFRRRADEGL